MNLINKVLIKYIENKGLYITNEYIENKENRRKIKYFINENETWFALKKRIDVYIEYLDECQFNCVYCYKKIDKKVFCQKCKLEYCLDCYLEKLKKNQGIIDCFNCNTKFGKKCDESELIIKMELIKSKFN
jgi:hypothetical protein